MSVITLINQAQEQLNRSSVVDFLAPLALRLYLAPVFWIAGTNKLADMDSVIAWFGNPEWGLGLPFPELMAWLAALTEAGGAILLLSGLAIRWISIPLMVTMLVAMFSVHWSNGWQAVADPLSAFPPEDVEGAMERLDRAKSILQEHGNYSWLTEKGGLVISNNGIEWSATYFVMCLSLFFMGAGRWLSVDYWLSRFFQADK